MAVPKKTIPRAIIIGTSTVATIYLMNTISITGVVGFEKLEATVIKSMNIPEERECLDIIYKQYAYIRFWIYDKYDDSAGVQKEYKLLKENGWLDSSVEKVYRRRNNFVWKILHSLKKGKING